jgi:amidase
VDEAISRIEALNPELNFLVSERFEQARKDAAGPLPDGPFRGVPLLIKDLHCPSAGDPEYEGTRFLRDAGRLADHDAATVRRCREVGFVILGRTNVPEFGSTTTTEPVAFGPCRNPWNPEYSTGGSSGGSAAAVAAGAVAAAHGSDGGGSIRIPASECGLVGLKPARGRVSKGPDVGEGWMGASTSGALTRTVRDAAAVLDVMAGLEPGDPYAAPALPRPLAEEVDAKPGALRIGLLDHPPAPDVPTAGEGAAAVAATGRLLEGLGHRVDVAHPAALGDTEFSSHFLRVIAVATAVEVANWSNRLGRPVRDEELEPSNAIFAGMGRNIPATDYLATVNWMHAYGRRVAEWWADWDVLVSPVLNGDTPRLGWLSDPDEGGARVATMLQYTAQWNMTGQPALSLPLHVSATGMPVGVQFVAGAGREDLLVRLAAQLEQVQPWVGRTPQVSAE